MISGEIAVGVGVSDGDGVGVGVSVGISVGVGVSVGVCVGVGVGADGEEYRAMKISAEALSATRVIGPPSAGVNVAEIWK